MGLFSRIFYGVDTDQDQIDLDRVDAELRAEQARDVARNPEKFNPAHQAQFDRHLEEQRIEDVDAEVNDAFRDGLNEGAGNIRRGVGGTINDLVVTPLKIIPWQVWLAGGLYGAWKLGWLNSIFKRLKP